MTGMVASVLLVARREMKDMNGARIARNVLGVALHERAARIGLYRPWADEVLPDMANYDALVVFGGEQAATDDHTHPYLPRLAGLMARVAI